MTSFYWITRLDAICEFSVAMIIVFCIVSVFLLSFGFAGLTTAYDEEDKDYITGKRLIKGGISTAVVALLFSMCAVFVPTTKEMCAIYVVDYLKDNEKVQKMPEQIIDAAAAWLDEQTQEEK